MLGNITLGHLYFPVSVWEGREPPIPSHPARYMSTSPELGTQTGQDPKKDVCDPELPLSIKWMEWVEEQIKKRKIYTHV